MNIQRDRRSRMVREQLMPRGINDAAVLKAMRSVPRHLFVPKDMRESAYADSPLPIGSGQTISQPYIVGLMSQLLQGAPGMRVLEIGTGSGYQAAVLRAMGMRVYSVERVEELYLRARDLFRRLKCTDISLKLADGTLGWPEEAPFDRILVTAGGPEIPAPLVEQLADPGILLMPVGSERRLQNLTRLYKQAGGTRRETGEGVLFVDLVGEHGWRQSIKVGESRAPI